MNRLQAFGTLLRNRGVAANYGTVLMKTHNSEVVRPSPFSYLRSAYRSLCCPLMGKMSSAMRRRRSSLCILEKQPIDVTNETNFGQARLPLNTNMLPTQRLPRIGMDERMLPTSNVWASWHAQRTIAAMNDRLDRARTDKRLLMERLRLPSPSKLQKLLNKPKTDKVPRPEVPIFQLRKDSPKLSTLQENAKKMSKHPELHRKIVEIRPILLIAKKQQQFGKTEHSKVFSKLKPQRDLTPVFPSKKINLTPKRTSSLQYLRCKHPLMPKKSAPVVAFHNWPKQTEHGNKSYETRLKALRIAQQTHLKTHPALDRNNLNVPRQQGQKGTLNGLAKSYGPRKSFGMSGRIRAHINTQPNENKVNQRCHLKIAKNVPKPRPPKIMYKKRERENLGHLLADLLDKKTSKGCESIAFKKTGPLFKLVTSSIEGRSNLYDGKFEKQLKKPLLYNYPFARNLNQSFSVNYRPAFVIQDGS